MSQRSKAIKKAVSDRKNSLKPKREPTFKQYENKFKEKIVDAFGEQDPSGL